MPVTVPFQTLLFKTARLCGIDPATLPQTLADMLAEWLQDRLSRAWTITTWPETLALEQRYYSPLWTTGSYAQGAVVYDATTTMAYWQASTAVTSADIPGASANWVLYAAPRVIPFAQAGQTIIGQPLNCWKDDPRLVRAPREVGMWNDGENVYPDPHAPNFVFLQFRKPAPVFSATPYDATLIYNPGDTFQWTDRNAWLVLATTTAGDTPATQAAKFAVQTAPVTLADFAARAAKADWLSDDGQDDKALQAEQLAASWLQDRLADLTILQRQTSNYSVAG